VLFLFSKESADDISHHPSYPQVTISEHTHHPQPFGIHYIIIAPALSAVTPGGAGFVKYA
jgi:hypothetical protein